MRPNRSWQVASGSTCMWFLIHCEKPLSRFLLMAPCHGLAVICWVWTALKHLRVYLLRRHKFHTPLKTVHTTLLNLHKSYKKQCRKTSDTFSPTFNILANSSSYTFCVCVCIPLHFHVYFLNIKHGDILLRNHSILINSGNSTKVLLFRKYISHFLFFHFYVW